MSEGKRQGHERVHGPYKHGNRWRVVFVGANGVSEVESYATVERANAEIAAARKTASDRTLGHAVSEYLTATSTGRQSSNDTARHRLYGILQLTAGDRPLAALTANVARKLYADRTQKVKSAATHQSELGYARRFCDWCVERGWLRVNPFADVQPVGEVKRGKPKLRVNHSRQFLEYLYGNPSLEATAALTAFVLGLRASEVVARTTDDLDDDGWLLWIRDTKTAAGDREIEVPAELRERLLALAAPLRPGTRLFGDLTRYGLHYHVVRLCQAAGVPRVTPHGLRGSGATRGVRMGGTVEEVARAMGHADKGRTLRRHYLGGGAEESARARLISGLVRSSYEATPSVPHSGSDKSAHCGNDARYADAGGLVTDADFALPTGISAEDDASN